jgi:hypothetical protein
LKAHGIEPAPERKPDDQEIAGPAQEVTKSKFENDWSSAEGRRFAEQGDPLMNPIRVCVAAVVWPKYSAEPQLSIAIGVREADFGPLTDGHYAGGMLRFYYRKVA